MAAAARARAAVTRLNTKSKLFVQFSFINELMYIFLV